MKISQEVKEALSNNDPVVALESTIISHGMPYPENLDMARKIERIVRDEGAVPATIAILEGVIHVGLNEDELMKLAQGSRVMKVSKRDIAYAISEKKDGATTVSATLLLAERAGINVFATGGIGGVHRFAENTFDISRDLEEIASCNVAVVSAGAKAILDLPKTLEYLETKGVEVIGYQTDSFPAFYTRESALSVTHRLDEPEAIARLMYAKWHLPLRGGIVIANPIPEEHSIPSEWIDEKINYALEEASSQGIKGKDTTPFLLSRVKELTEGSSLKANLELVYNNAVLAARIAKSYSQLVKQNP
ncbi:MAG: pseudouridine-5'-phosphate glycosidase [Selenomonadales bacterium]|nr:pseudouridine-5'-phosphate glycosidase [Selenomonadales bacterium]